MMEHILKSSLEQGSIITIIYAKENVITKRNICVLGIDSTHVKAYCYLRGQNRVFKKENILAAEYCRKKAYIE